MNIKVMLTEEEVKLLLQALGTEKTGSTQYTQDLIEKVEMYLESKLADSK